MKARRNPARAVLASLALMLACSDDSDKDGIEFDASISTGGDGGAGGESSNPLNPNSATCGPHRVDAGRVTPDILIVLDRSASMTNTGVDRWGPSVSGIKMLTASTGSVVNYGLMVFPRSDTSMVPGSDGRETYSCEPGRVEVPIGANTAGAIASSLDGIRPGGATPTAATLEAARTEVLRDFDPDAKVRPSYVLLVTDGAPNCTGGVFNGGNGPAAQEPQAVEASKAILADLNAKGVSTYVLGYDAANNRQLAAALNEMAQAGGTNEYRPVDDQASLLEEFQRITGQAVSCDYALDGTVDDPTVVSVKLDGKAIPFLPDGSGDGWKLSGNSKIVSLTGKFCETLLDGKDRALEVVVTCGPVLVE